MRLEWGPAGVELLAAACAVVIVVDVLSFCTSVDIAVGRGAAVLPQRWAPLDPVGSDPAAASAQPVLDPAAVQEAVRLGAVPAGPRDGNGPSLRPSSLLELATGSRLALPSPNGATLCAMAATGTAVVLSGCLRNASAVAAAALAVGGPIGLVPAGERWPDATMRVAAEDAIGAGAIAAALPPDDRSPEAELAVAQFRACGERGLGVVLAAVSSGRELVADGYGADVELAAALDVSTAAPRLRAGMLTGG